MTAEGGNVVEGQDDGAGLGPGAARVMDTMEGFAFEDEDELDALMQMEQPSQKQVVPTTIINTTTSGVEENGDNTKPKEQND